MDMMTVLHHACVTAVKVHAVAVFLLEAACCRALLVTLVNWFAV